MQRGEQGEIESYKTKEVKLRITKKSAKNKKNKGKKKYQIKYNFIFGQSILYNKV